MTYRRLPLYHADDPGALILPTLTNNMEIGQLLVGRCETVAVFIQGSKLDDDLDAIFFVLAGVGIVGIVGSR